MPQGQSHGNAGRGKRGASAARPPCATAQHLCRRCRSAQLKRELIAETRPCNHAIYSTNDIQSCMHLSVARPVPAEAWKSASCRTERTSSNTCLDSLWLHAAMLVARRTGTKMACWPSSGRLPQGLTQRQHQPAPPEDAPKEAMERFCTQNV